MANGANVYFGQFRMIMLLTDLVRTVFYFVPVVVLSCVPAEVTQPVIFTVAVGVAAFVFFWIFSYERGQDQVVYGERAVVAFVTYVHNDVSSAKVNFFYPLPLSAFFTPYAAVATDFVIGKSCGESSETVLTADCKFDTIRHDPDSCKVGVVRQGM